jgi:Predicted Fe-S oxidoreductases
MPSEIKPIAGLERRILSEVIPLSGPFTVYIFPTTFCNFKCSYCAHSLKRDIIKEKYGLTPQHMSLDTLTCIITQLKVFPNKLKVISLTGHGEPLLNPKLSTMVEMVKTANVTERVEIITNASLLTHGIADDLIHAGLDTIRISIQGLSSKKYYDICGYSLNFDTLIENIRYFYHRKKNCNVYVKIMDIALDPGEEKKFYSLFNDISDRMYIEKCRPVYNGVKMTDNMDSIMDRYGRLHENRKICPLCFLYAWNFPGW